MILVSDNGTGYCPLTGRALKLGFFHGNPRVMQPSEDFFHRSINPSILSD